MNSVFKYGLDITRMAFSGGEPLAPYIDAFDIDLFLNKALKDVQSLIDFKKSAAAYIYEPDSKTLLKIWEQMKDKSFLNYNVDIKKQEEHIEELKGLSLKEQKQHLCELLDKNQLYVNLSSLNDKDFACTDEEKQVTKNFYQIIK